MKKLRYLYLFLSILPLAGIIYVISSTFTWYGNSYSEQQRKDWNGILGQNSPRALSDRHYTQKNYEWSETSEGWYRIGDTMKEIHTSPYPKKENDAILARYYSLSERQSREAPDWNVNLPETVENSPLPLEGLTEYELLKKADQGDVNALMELICRFTLLQPQHTTRVKIQTWLEKAEQMNRPGAGFLLNLYRLNSQHPSTKSYIKSRITPSYISSLQGFEDFRLLLRSGDYTLFRIISQIEPKVQEGELTEDILSALEVKAKGNNPADQRRLGEFYWRKPIFDLAVQIDGPKPKFYFPTLWTRFTSFFYQKKNITWENCLMGEDLLKKAAHAGDLPARHLWLTKAFSVKRKLQQSEWQDIFTYAQSLIESGYAPFLEELSIQNDTERDTPKEFLYYHGTLNILANYYKANTVNQLVSKIKDHLYTRGNYCLLSSNIWDLIIEAERGKEKRIDTCLKALSLNPSFLYPFHCSGKLPDSQEVREKVLESLHTLAQQGDPISQFYLAHLYEFGLGVPKDPRRASALLEQSIILEQTYPIPSISVLSASVPTVELKGKQHYLREWARMKYILLNLLEEFPERNIPKACQLLNEIQADELTDLYSPYIPFCTALTAELGLNGMEKNFEKALTTYKKGETDYHYYRLAYLYTHGEGVPRNEKQALEYIKKAKQKNRYCPMHGAIRANRTLSAK